MRAERQQRVYVAVAIFCGGLLVGCVIYAAVAFAHESHSCLDHLDPRVSQLARRIQAIWTVDRSLLGDTWCVSFAGEVPDLNLLRYMVVDNHPNIVLGNVKEGEPICMSPDYFPATKAYILDFRQRIVDCQHFAYSR